MSAAEGSLGTRLWDRVTASDPGLLRLAAGSRTAGSIALTLAVLTALRVPVPHLVAGAIASMAATFAIREKQRSQQALTLALGLPVALASVTLGALLNSRVIAGDLFFVVLIFCAVYSRRFGDRGNALGLIGFQIYFMSLFVGATGHTLPALFGVVTVAFAASALVRFVIVYETPAGVLLRLREAFRVRLAQLVSAQLELLDAGPGDADKALDAVREGTARLHETALMIQGRLEQGTSDESVARLVQRRIAGAEISAERLGLLLLTARSSERTDTLTLHLPGAPVPSGGREP
ncbi:FUSC family protein, partial [Streptomyces sp. SID625]|nr:FUSC family protein [Streptomyces sp. SID625]